VLDDVLGGLACPQCGAGLGRDGGALRCPAGHGFDIARHGYVSLLPVGRRPPAGDTAEMVAARAAFLAAGHYAGLAAALAGVAAEDAGAVPGLVADVGAGTGYYLAAVLDAVPGRAGLALDASRYALRRAARAHPRIGAVRADAWARLPVADGTAALALNVFAPRDGAQLRRILHPRGRLLVVTPGPDHLAELTGPLGLLSVDARKDERLAAKLGPHFTLAGRHGYRTRVELDHEGVAAAAGMGPSAWHADPAGLAARVAARPARSSVTVSATIWSFRPRDGQTAR
jgi:23S rRNA (guanine745-N1)-methyltransferase